MLERGKQKSLGEKVLLKASRKEVNVEIVSGVSGRQVARWGLMVVVNSGADTERCLGVQEW